MEARDIVSTVFDWNSKTKGGAVNGSQVCGIQNENEQER